MPDYLNPAPPPTDPDAIAQAAFDRIRESFPNYEPRESQLATIVIVALALRAAEIADLIPLIPTSIFRWFGANVIGLLPIDGSPETAAVTVFVRDDAGYVIDAGTNLALTDSEGNATLFAFDDDAVIPTDATSAGPFSVTALDPGALANHITAGAATLVEALDFVTDIAQLGTSSGGTDPETDTNYLNRLTRRLGLIPRPVLAEDFAALAMVEFPEIWRMAALNHYGPGVNQVNRIVTTGTVSGGTYTLTLDGQVTSALAYNATPATVQAALEALSNTAPGDVIVTDSGLGYYRVEHRGAFVYTGRTFTITSSVTGGGTMTVTTDTAAVTPDPAAAGVVSVAGQGLDGLALSPATKLAVDVLLQANREWGFVVNVVDFDYHALDATFTFTTDKNYDPTDVEARAEQAVRDFADPTTFAAPPDDPRGVKVVSMVYLWELVGTLEAVKGLDRLVTLTIGIDGGVQTAADKSLTGDLPMLMPGTINGTAI
jgi:hypothetical protein